MILICSLKLNGALLALLGESDILAGQVLCPHSPPNILASFSEVKVSPKEWIVPGVCAYVPQSAWLRNASIKGWHFLFYNIRHPNSYYPKKIFFSTSLMTKNGTLRRWKCVHC